jgi:proteasome assembly chaperone (PAC2) family protein
VADELRVERRPDLTRPVLIAAFRGWNDGAQAASLAAGYLAKTWQAELFADVDPEEFFDFQAARPHVSLEDGLTRRIDWPETAFYHARPDGSERDVVLLLGIEPNLRWRTFTELLIGLVRELGVEMMITLGALLADVPHTRPSPVTGSASDPKLVRQLGLSSSRYEGPTGIVGVLHDTVRKAGLTSGSFWAPVPHYVATPPNPVATRALLEAFGVFSGGSLDLRELGVAADAWRTRVDSAIEDDDEMRAYVRALEEQSVDDEDESSPAEDQIPSGDDLA